MKRLVGALVLIILLSSFLKKPTLKGVWEYAGGLSNGKLFPAPNGYSQQRKYTATQFDAFLLEKGEKPIKYESGTYTLIADTCLETQTYCLQAQNMIGIPIHYAYEIRKDTLVLKGKLPNGGVVVDYWKKVK